MSLIWCESFDGVTTPFRLYEKWEEAAHLSISGGASSLEFVTGVHGQALSYTTGSGPHRTFDVSQRHDKIVVGFYYRRPGVGFRPLLWLPLSATPATAGHKLELHMSTNGSLELGRTGVSGSSSISTPTDILTQNVWHFVEIEVVLQAGNPTTDTYAGIIRVDAVEWASGLFSRGSDSPGGQPQGIFLRGVDSGSKGANQYDDMYVLNGAGSINNKFFGAVHVEALFPTGNGDSSQLLGSDGDSTDNHLLVDDPDVNVSDYVEHNAVGNTDLYAYGDPASTLPLAAGLQINTVAVQLDPTDPRDIAAVVKEAGVSQDQTKHDLSNTIRWYNRMSEAKPSGGAWSKAAISGSQFGVKVESG